MTYTLSDIINNIKTLSLDSDVVMLECGPTTESDQEPVRIEAMIIMLVGRGTAHISIDLMDYELGPGSIAVIQPKNLVHAFRTSEDFHGGVLAYSRESLEAILPRLSELTPLLMSRRTEPVTQLTPEQADVIAELFLLITRKIQNPSPFRRQKVLCLLQSIMYELLDFSNPAEDLPRMRRTRREELMARFILAVSENFRTERSVSAYAEMLSITPKHLSAVVKETSGLTAGQWIENYTIMEAKVLLRTTDLSIQQIAAELNFPNQSFFGKYFKHQAGISPSRYRQSLP